MESTTAAAHLGTEHLHENLRVNIHATTHSTAAESFHGVNEILAAIVTRSLPVQKSACQASVCSVVFTYCGSLKVS